MNKVFSENVVIITGASSGIGAELALQLAAQDAWLALAARDEARLNAVAQDCRQRGGRALVVKTDVTDPAQCAALVAQTAQAYGRIDTLINNAGIGMWARFEDVQDLALFEKIMRVNYLGSVYCAFYALPHLKRSRGRIVAVSSLTGKTGVPTRSGYAASKHALGGFFDSLRIELANTGVTITIAFPDFVATPIRQSNFGADGKPLQTSPMNERGLMSAEECARHILRGMQKRAREVVMTPRGRIIGWGKLIAPALVDRLTATAIARRHRKA
ncbi:MAG: SDR family oxidoreductase [Chloroflexi bacterium]|nr:SDR family oxidoreductase [Chloroflexota bacterium]